MGHDGRRLAVKVQHAGLRESGDVDVATIGVAADILRYFAPDYDYRWVVDETRTNLPLVRHSLVYIQPCISTLPNLRRNRCFAARPRLLLARQ